VFLGARKDVLERAIALDYVRHGLELARKSSSELAAAFNVEISRAVRHIQKRSEAAGDIISMHKRHGEVVSRVLEQTLRANAASVVGGTLNPTALLAMVAQGQHLPPSDRPFAGSIENGSLGGAPASVQSDKTFEAAVLASLQHLHTKIDAGPVRKAPQRTNARPKRRDSILFAAITLELEGPKYCAFLRDHAVSPKWEKPCPSGYDVGYKAGQPWRKKIQDEKCRAKKKMETYADSALADAFNFYLPDKFKELGELLNSAKLAPRA